MLCTISASNESHRLGALIRHRVGWQLDDLHVLVADRGLTLTSHAFTVIARILAETEAERLSGLPVVANEIEVN